MKESKDKYVQLYNKISDIILELMDVHTMIEDIYAIEKHDTGTSQVVASNRKKKRRMSILDSAVDEFSIAMVNDGIDTETILKLEDILKKKKDELEK